MAMPAKRPLADPAQYYAYTWYLAGIYLYVGHGKNNRCRPECKASWGGRSAALLEVLEHHRHEIEVEVIPCQTQTEARKLEAELIAELKPKHNRAPGCGGWKGMHSAQGKQNISLANTGRKLTLEHRKIISQSLIGNKHMLGKKHSAETKAKISEFLKTRPVSDKTRQSASERMKKLLKTNPPRKGKICSPEHRRKLSEAKIKYYERKRNASKV